MVSAQQSPPMADARLAAGALLLDAHRRLLLVRPIYKEHWDIPGGYVEPGESPRHACARELAEELGITVNFGRLLVVDWAPRPDEGDKLLFVFDGGTLDPEQLARVQLPPNELAEYAFVTLEDAERLTPPRLRRRLTAALSALDGGTTDYLEHGQPAAPTRQPSVTG